MKLTQQLQIDGWKTTFLLRRPIFRCYVSSQEVIFCKTNVQALLEYVPSHWSKDPIKYTLKIYSLPVKTSHGSNHFTNMFTVMSIVLIKWITTPM